MAVCLSGNHYSVCNCQTSETEKRGKCFPSQREWERGNVVRDRKWIHMFVDRFYPHSRQYCTDGELSRVQLPWSVELPIIPVPDLRSSSKMNHFHVSAHHIFSQLICKSPMSSFPFLCSGREPRQRESFPLKLTALRLIRRVHTHTHTHTHTGFLWIIYVPVA